MNNFGLQERTYTFAQKVRAFSKRLPRTVGNLKDVPQLIASSGSVAANFIESAEAISPKDSLYRIKICRKESKESHLWLRLLDTGRSSDVENERKKLVNEAFELACIFGSIVNKKKAI